MIINVRGGHGTGKTYLVRKIIEHFGVKKEITKDGRVLGYLLRGKPRIYVLGRYGEQACGGCDVFVSYKNLYEPGYNQADLICDLVRKYHKRGHIIFEGIVISSAPLRCIALAKECKNFVFGYPDVSLSRAIKRVTKRRAASHRNLPPLKEGNIARKYHEVHVTGKKRLLDAGMDVRLLPREDAVDAILSWLKE